MMNRVARQTSERRRCRWTNATSTDDDQVRAALFGRHKQALPRVTRTGDRLGRSPQGFWQMPSGALKYGRGQEAFQLCFARTGVGDRTHIYRRRRLVERNFVPVRCQQPADELQGRKTAQRAVHTDEHTHE